MQFNEFIKITDCLEENGPFCAESFSWAKQIVLPDIDLSLPSLKKTSRIAILSDRTNPIYVQLEDGSKLFFSYDQFRRIQGSPAVGKTMILTMQRLVGDNSNTPSKIDSCKVI